MLDVLNITTFVHCLFFVVKQQSRKKETKMKNSKVKRLVLFTFFFFFFLRNMSPSYIPTPYYASSSIDTVPTAAAVGL